MQKRLLGSGAVLVLAVAYGTINAVGLMDDAGKTGELLQASDHWLPTLIAGGLITVIHWPDIRRNAREWMYRENATPESPRERIDGLIDEGYALRALVEENNRPLPETRYHQWRSVVKRELTELVGPEFAEQWDGTRRKPQQGFTGFLNSNRVRAWNEVTARVEQLEQIREGLRPN